MHLRIADCLNWAKPKNLLIVWGALTSVAEDYVCIKNQPPTLAADLRIR
jgi:hypothetical protein